MEESVLKTVKKILGIEPTYDEFDIDIITHINAVFVVLQQLGVGPKTGFMITGDTEKWTDFIEDTTVLNMVKSYMYAKVRMAFDPPVQSGVKESLNEIIKEYEWRLNAAVDPEGTFTGGDET